MAKKRLRRSELSTPGHSPKMIAKAAASDADLVFLDLEDSVVASSLMVLTISIGATRLRRCASIR